VKPEALVNRRSDRLDTAALAAAVRGPLRDRVRRIEVFAELPSTNQHLLEAAQPAPGQLDVCLAEFQTAGRGRLGRSWHAPFGAGLCLSVAWQFGATPPDLAALPLALGVAVRRVVEELTRAAISLKWPNDIVHEHRKLGGILVEASAEAHSGCRIVGGLGLNVAFPAESLATVSDWERGATDLRAITHGEPPARTELALNLIIAFAELFGSYAGTGFAPYRAEWRDADYLKGRSIRLQSPAGQSVGVAAGIDDDGALVIAGEDGRRRRVVSGDVSVRVDA
jgi:BirA family biotin operon repressor/biotin-[acetyl-CoA-carboxylase] ligase